MKLADLDRKNGAAVTRCLQWLETLTQSAAVEWNADQRDAAREDLAQARAVMGRELLALAQDAFARVHILQRIDAAEVESFPGHHVACAMQRRGR